LSYRTVVEQRDVIIEESFFLKVYQRFIRVHSDWADCASPGRMLQPDFDPAPRTLRIYRCGYVSKCKKHRCQERATLIAEKVDVASRHVRQIELCTRHGDVVIESARSRDLEISDRRDE